ncbi:MAG: hypothetical protein DRJ98_06025 [Thermoprotei archaeon]|nr:MAG: hypothetical protein DRJ98_06025 [Thermoprotei archaeon]
MTYFYSQPLKGLESGVNSRVPILWEALALPLMFVVEAWSILYLMNTPSTTIKWAWRLLGLAALPSITTSLALSVLGLSLAQLLYDLSPAIWGVGLGIATHGIVVGLSEVIRGLRCTGWPQSPSPRA